MTYYIMLENGQPERYTATVLGLPNCTATGATRQEAIQRVKQVMLERLARSEIIPIEVEPHELAKAVDVGLPPNPWVQFAGMHKDNPLFSDVLEYIEEYRRELDNDETVP